MKLPTISLVIVAVCFGPYGWINATPSSAIVDSLNQVSLDFFKVALKNEPDNFVFLPLGISQLLAMTAFGAGGETRSELQKFLHMENLTDNLNNYTSDFMTKLDSVLNLQSMIFINQNIKLKSNFKNSNVNQINFENSRDATSIIKWFIYQKTKRDMDLFKPDDIKKNDSIFLINVNHFEAEWQNRFRPEYTSSKLFYLNNTSKIHVPTMKLWDWFLIVKNKDLDARIIQLFYRINDDYEQVSMFIIIPNKIEGLKHIEDNIDKINFTTLIDPGYDNQLTEIQLLLPKFKLDTKIDYKKHLEKMGVNDAFTTNANFSGISQDKNLIIDKIIQKTTIEVDENGSGYGSHSANYINKKPKRRIKKVKVNRPFLVVITTRNFIVFTGRVSKP